MPVVRFEASGAGASIEIEAPDGAYLVDLCDQTSAPVPFSCRSASCGTCRVDLLEGAALLEPPSEAELDVLCLFGDDPGHRRLACQARLRSGQGRKRLRVRAAHDD
jgi:2Fe-2S ferredoxin